MPWPEQLVSVPMARVGVVAPRSRLRRVLVETADAGVFEPDPGEGEERGGRGRPDPSDPSIEPRITDQPRSRHELEAGDRPELLLGEAELERVTSSAVLTDDCAVLTGWVPRGDLDPLRDRLRPHGGAVAELRARRGVEAPTAHTSPPSTGALRPLVATYATVPYRDLDPTLFAAIAYMLMFGMMFGDVGHGAALGLFGAAALLRPESTLGRIRSVAPFLLGAGLAAMGFGFLYGEAMGPTGLVPTLWIRPLDEPETLLLAGLVGGACLLAITFILATINRWREGGVSLALYAASGVGGSLLFAGAAALVGGLVGSLPWLSRAGAAVAAIGAALIFAGLVVEAGSGASAVAQAAVEMFDTVLRLGSNVVSFARLAAFGLTHAVITGVVWDGAAGLWARSSVLGVIGSIALFTVGNIAAFALGALVGAIQALRLEYYEMFSRLFTSEGRPFQPWHLTLERTEAL